MNQIQFNGLSFKLDHCNQTACIIGIIEENEHVFIPRSVVFNSHDYIITDINGKVFEKSRCIRFVEFSEDSEIKFFNKNLFTSPFLKKITIPPKVEEVKEEWCKNTNDLKQVLISPKNKFFKYVDKEHKLICCKSNPTNENYDFLVFACRDIETAIIPSTVKYIGPYCFNFCLNLKNVVFPDDSQLISISKNAFSLSSIENINIPSNLQVLEDGWCKKATRLKNICISSNNKCFGYLDDKHKIIVGKTNQQNDFFDILICVLPNAKNISIPSTIKYIHSYSFNNRSNVKKIEIKEDSQLISLGKYAFSMSHIDKIFIPSNVSII